MTVDKENTIIEKSYAFALRIIRFYRYFSEERHEYVICRQLLRCGTSIGANVKESTQAQSPLDFVSKLSIALKEASESEYWILLLRDSEYLTQEQADSLLCDCQELIKLLTKIIKTKKANLEAEKAKK